VHSSLIISRRFLIGFIMLHKRATCPADLIPLDLSTPIIFDEQRHVNFLQIICIIISLLSCSKVTGK
jgi:hypothetical protein